MSSIIEGYNYDIFISYRQKNEGERGRGGDLGTKRLRDKETRQCTV
jgi:hypothetical protein